MAWKSERIGLLAAVVLVTVWACETKSPVEPTRPPATCTFTLSSTSLSLGPAEGKASLTVSAEASCAWTAASDRGWMTIAAGASGTGPGVVTVMLTANPGPDPRTATLTIAGQAVAVRQDGVVACTTTVSPESAAFSKDLANGTFTVTAPQSCAWSASSNVEWIVITSAAGGSGPGVVAYSVARNSGAAARVGHINVGDARVTIAQQGDSGLCEFHVTPVLINACMAEPYELVVNVTTQAGCSWVATSDTAWIAMNGAASASGPGDIRFRIGDNYAAPRLGVLKVRWDTPTAGQNVQVSQAGCRYAVSTTGVNAPAGGGSFTVDVYQQSDPLECGGPLQDRCVWSATVSAAWITVTTAMPQSGDGRFSFTVAPNTAGPRSAEITVRDKSVVVVQAGR